MSENQAMNFWEYLNWCTEMLRKTKSPKHYENRVVFPARRFVHTQEKEGDIAIPLAGYTIITPPGDEDKDNADAYDYLSNVLNALKNVPKTVCAKPDTLHITLADLVSEESYAKLLVDGKNEELIDCVASLFGQMGVLTECKMKIQGVGLLPDCVVAVVSPIDMDSYEVLPRFRDRLYGSPELQALGVKRKEPYGFHITLGYIERYLSADERGAMTETFNNINSNWPREPRDEVGFNIHTAVLSKFENMRKFEKVKKNISFGFGSVHPNQPLNNENAPDQPS